MTAENLVKLLQMTGAALATPAAAVGTFLAYQSHFSSDVTCQKLRNNVIAIMGRDRTTKKAAKMNVERAPTRNCWLRKR
jgi:hypothetical protein